MLTAVSLKGGETNTAYRRKGTLSCMLDSTGTVFEKLIKSGLTEIIRAAGEFLLKNIKPTIMQG